MGKKVTSISVDEETWREFKSRVAEKGETLTSVLNHLILSYLKGRNVVSG